MTASERAGDAPREPSEKACQAAQDVEASLWQPSAEGGVQHLKWTLASWRQFLRAAYAVDFPAGAAPKGSPSDEEPAEVEARLYGKIYDVLDATDLRYRGNVAEIAERIIELARASERPGDHK